MTQTLFYAAGAAVFQFVLQLLFCFGAKRRRLRLLPVWLLCAAVLAVTAYWLTGSAADSAVLTLRQAQCLVFGLLCLAGAAGDGLAWGVWWAGRWHTGR